jgi:hypothetical protein
LTQSETIKISDICLAKNKKFISIQTNGMIGSITVSAGIHPCKTINSRFFEKNNKKRTAHFRTFPLTLRLFRHFRLGLFDGHAHFRKRDYFKKYPVSSHPAQEDQEMVGGE